ncbi:MAG: glycosyltransferase family 4 protein [Candidatus Curtissbacteria bacterium]|nr:glycosyltransferase family 4 protein [Candidatus Curtissbacteria bacterium]
MKVAVIIDTWFPHMGGGQINALEISKILAGRGIKIDIITRNNGKEGFKYPKNLNVYKLGSRTKPFDSFSKLMFLISSFRFIRAGNYDLVHAHAFLPGITARLLSVFYAKPSVFTVHGTALGSNLNSRLKLWIERFILTQIKYDMQITVSRDFFKIRNKNKKISYIPNGVNTQVFDRTKKSKEKTLIFVGRLHPQKNLINLVKAMVEVKKKFPKITLIIVGAGPQEKELKDLINKIGLKNNVKMTGQKTGRELIKLYKSSHLFVLPSIYEGQPLSLLEAWASKTPAVVTKTGDCAYLIKENVNGFLIEDPTDYRQIAKKIIKALKSKNLNKIGESGYNFVKKNFSWEKSAQETLKVYESLTKTAS